MRPVRDAAPDGAHSPPPQGRRAISQSEFRHRLLKLGVCLSVVPGGFRIPERTMKGRRGFRARSLLLSFCPQKLHLRCIRSDDAV